MDSQKFDTLEVFESIPDTKYEYVLSMFYKKDFNLKLYVRADLRIFKYKIFKVEHKKINGFVQVKEMQKHPVNEKVVHLDFMIIDETTKNLRMHVPLYYYNKDKSPGIKLGGFLKENSRALEVKLASYDKLHAWLGVDLKGFEANQNLKLSHVHFPEGMIPIRKEITVGTIMPSKGSES